MYLYPLLTKSIMTVNRIHYTLYACLHKLLHKLVQVCVLLVSVVVHTKVTLAQDCN